MQYISQFKRQALRFTINFWELEDTPFSFFITNTIIKIVDFADRSMADSIISPPSCPAVTGDDNLQLLAKIFGRGSLKYFNIFAYVAVGFVLVMTLITLLAVIGNFLFKRKVNYKGKHVLITGGSSGIGLELAKRYLKAGAKVTIVARNEKNLKSAIQHLQGSDKKYEGFVDMQAVDCSESYAKVEEKFKEAEKKFGSIEVLVNCAGVSICDKLEDLKLEEYERMLKINVLGSMYPSRYVLPSMKEKKFGRIVFVSSQVAQAAIYGYTAYAASKWALRGLAEALQMECAHHNIFVSVSYPPDTDTPGYKQEMTTKPNLTKKISESGSVFPPESVANDIFTGSTRGYFGISNGLDGWLLKQLHPGMSPVNCFFEAWQQVLFSGLARLISVFIVSDWYSMTKKHEAPAEK